MSSPKCRDFYQELIVKLEERSRLEGVMGIMHWDQEVIMPSGATDARSKQMATLAGVIHEKSIDPEFGNLINKIKIKEFSDIEQCNVNEAKRIFELET